MNVIIQKEIEVTVNNGKISFYREHGFPNCKRYDKIIIPVEWLGNTSKVEVLCECDYCHKQYYKAYGNIMAGRKNIEKDACLDCKYKKIEEVNYAKYGVKTNLMLEENKEKSRKTIKEKYNVDNVMQCKEIREKQQKSIEKHYGVKSPILNPDIKEKIRKTNVERYGGEFTRNGFLLINGVWCSKSQKEICDYFKFKINCEISGYWVDGLKDNVIIEYNGGGHDIAVSKGQITQEDFDEKEQIRINTLSKNYALLIIENRADIDITEKHYNDIQGILNNIKQSEIVYYEVK